MVEEMKDAEQTNEVNTLTHSKAAAFPNRREFLGQAGAAAAVVTGAQPGRLQRSDNEQNQQCFCRTEQQSVANVRGPLAAAAEAIIPPHATNGDDALSDKSDLFKGCCKRAQARRSQCALRSRQLNSSRPSDFEKIIAGGARTQNGPQGARWHGRY